MFVKPTNLPGSYNVGIIGLGHTEPTLCPQKFSVVSQLEFINNHLVAVDVMDKITDNGRISVNDVAQKWAEKVGDYRTFFSGTTAELGIIAAKACLANSCFDATQLEAIICATNTGPGYPSLADYVKEGLRLENEAMCFDVTEACVAGSTAIFNAWSLIRSGACQNVLVVISETATRLPNLDNWEGSNLFGDAAAAILLRGYLPDRRIKKEDCFEFFYQNTDTAKGKIDYIQKTENGFVQNGSKVHAYIISSAVESLVKAVERAGIDPKDIAHLICHQPSNRTLESFFSNLKKAWPKFKGECHRSDGIGNASSASAWHLFSDLFHQGKIEPKQLVVTCTFGAGMAIGINAFRF